MASSLAAPPLKDAIVELAKGPSQGTMTKVFENWLRALAGRAGSAAVSARDPIRLTGQDAAIGLTTILPLASGLYRIFWRFRVTTPATSSSALQLTITTTEGAVTVTQDSLNYTGNAVDEPQSGVFVVRVDPSSPLQYSTTYSSSGATDMEYELELLLESV